MIDIRPFGILAAFLSLSCSHFSEPIGEVTQHERPYYESRTQARTYTNDAGETMDYRLFVPADYDSRKENPLLLILHGAGARGGDNLRQLTHWNAGWTDDAVQAKHPCIILMPQCQLNQKWADVKSWRDGSYSFHDLPLSNPLRLAKEILGKTIEEHSVDRSRIYVMGASMGGYGTWNIIMRYPNLFAAAVPICGAGDPAMGPILTDLPIWAFHGDEDKTVPFSGSTDMLDSIREAGGKKMKLKAYPGMGHGSYHFAWKEGALVDWVFAQKKEPAKKIRILRDVQYGTGDSQSQTLDAYLVESKKPAPVIVIIHGGGWYKGEKSGPKLERSTGPIETLQKRGISLVSINYRLTGEAPWPAQLDDTARALQFVRSKASEWNIDPKKIGLLGSSAGSHISMMLGFSPDRANPGSDDPVERQSTKVQCIIEKGGQTDLDAFIKAKVAEGSPPIDMFLALLGVDADAWDTDEFHQRLRAISPVNYVTPDCPPVFMMYEGPQDAESANDERLKFDIHSPKFGFLLRDQLDENNVAYEFVLEPKLKDEGNKLRAEVQQRYIDFFFRAVKSH